MVLALLVGRFTGRPEGVTNDDVNMKKTSNRKIRSVIEAMLKLASILFFDPIFMVRNVDLFAADVEVKSYAALSHNSATPIWVPEEDL